MTICRGLNITQLKLDAWLDCFKREEGESAVEEFIFQIRDLFYFGSNRM